MLSRLLYKSRNILQKDLLIKRNVLYINTKNRKIAGRHVQHSSYLSFDVNPLFLIAAVDLRLSFDIAADLLNSSISSLFMILASS
jgi:hypothetical protein